MNFNLLLSDDFNKYAANVTVSGVAIVFAMLVLLVLIITVFGKIMSAAANKSAKQKKSTQVTTAPEKSAAPAVINTASDDDEIIAVISAAVATLYSGSGKTAVVRSIKPSQSAGRSAWASAGINQNIKSF